jgi:hypothetical protein
MHPACTGIANGITSNMNFIAWIARKVPELELDLPFTVIGSGYEN